jgi:peptidoglycan/xylan/chitin deacetylase (PgdA/CDA1 family)
MAGQRLVLAYHNIVPDGQPAAGDRSLHLPLATFRRQLDVLVAHCDVVSLPVLLQSGPSARPRIAITFDDAYHGAMVLGLAELGRRALPVTVFLAPGRFGDAGFWWDRLATAEGLSAPVRDAALERLQGREELVGAPAVPLPDSHACATEAIVRAAVHEGVTYGAHTWTHPNLATLDPALLHEELARPLAWLRQSSLPMLPCIAYPYGRSSPAVAAAAREAGYEGGFLVEGGWLRPGGDAFAIPRFNVPRGLSDDGFMLRLSGALPA